MTSDHHWAENETLLYPATHVPDAMARQIYGATPAQREMYNTLDHTEYQGVGTCGFARITDIDGRGSLVSRIRPLARHDTVHSVVEDGDGARIRTVID